MTLALLALRPPRSAPPPPGGGGDLVGVAVMMAFSLVIFLLMMGVMTWIVSSRGKEVRDRAERAFGPLGIRGARYILMSWRGSGHWAGRGITATVMAGQRGSPPSMFLELASSSRFDLSVGPPIGDAGRWLRDKLSNGVEIATPNLPGVSLFTTDPSRGTTTADAASVALRRLMTPRSGGQVRYVFVRAGVVKLHVVGSALQTLTTESARADLEDLVAVAQAAEQY